MNNSFNKESNFISAVVYVNDYKDETKKFICDICNLLDNNFKTYEVICVVDGKSKELFKNDVDYFCGKSNISVIYMAGEQGVEASMKAGINLAIGDYVIEFDSTYKDYEDVLIMNVYKEILRGGYDVVTANPPLSFSSFESRAFYRIFNYFSELKVNISTERFRIVSRRAINKAMAYSKTIPYRKVGYIASGLRVMNVDYIPTCNIKKKGKDLFRKETAIDSILLFTNIIYKVSVMMSLIMAILMMFFLGYTCFIYFGSYNPVEGWSPVMGVLTVGFWGMFLLITFLIKYLEMLLKLNFKNKEYLVESIEKISN